MVRSMARPRGRGNANRRGPERHDAGDMPPVPIRIGFRDRFERRAELPGFRARPTHFLIAKMVRRQTSRGGRGGLGRSGWIAPRGISTPMVFDILPSVRRLYPWLEVKHQISVRSP